MSENIGIFITMQRNASTENPLKSFRYVSGTLTCVSVQAKRLNRRGIITKAVGLVSLVYLLQMAISCKMGDQVEDRIIYYQDYDVLHKTGIAKLSDLDLKSRLDKGLIVYKLVYNANILDSVCIINPFKNAPAIKLSLHCKGNICIYKTDYSYEGFGYYPYYYVITPKQIQRLAQLEDCFDVITMTENQCSGRLRFIFSYKDTLDFQKQLFDQKPLKLKVMSSHPLQKYSNRISKYVTFTDLLSFKKTL